MVCIMAKQEVAIVENSRKLNRCAQSHQDESIWLIVVAVCLQRETTSADR